MNKKIFIVVGLAAAVAVSAGVISLSGGHSRGEDADPVSSYRSAAEPATGATTDEISTADADDPTVESTDNGSEQSTESHGNDIHGYSDDIVSASSYNVVRAIDHTAGRECTVREVFGTMYYYCFLRFGSDGKVEICLNPVSGEVRKGEYLIYDDVISVKYDDGSGAEYDIITDNSGDIEYIVVDYGDFDVYFG